MLKKYVVTVMTAGLVLLNSPVSSVAAASSFQGPFDDNDFSRFPDAPPFLSSSGCYGTGETL